MNIEFVNILDVDENLIEQVRRWRNSESVSKYMFTNHYITKEEHKKWMEKLKKESTAKSWIIIYNKKPVGLASLSDIDYKNKITDWGFYIADESLRGKGIGSATLNRLMSIVFDEMILKKMKTRVLENNKIAIKLYEKMGFKKEGRPKQQLIRNGKSVNVITMGISNEKWKKIKKIKII